MNPVEFRAARLRNEPALKAARLMLDCFASGDEAVIDAFIDRGGTLFGSPATRETLGVFSAYKWSCTTIDELPPIILVVVDMNALIGVEPDCVVLAQITNGAQERTLGLAIVGDAPIAIFDPRPIAQAGYAQVVELSSVLAQVG
jgi:hypothetical protein